MNDFRQQIGRQADGVAQMYLDGERADQPMTRQQKEFIEGIIAADYDGRTIIELLQNGHDAHPRELRTGRLEFLLAEDEAEHGVLYVANGGGPVAPEDFRGMCRIAMSPKRPDQGIGNKGVGFKSVLQLSESPEVYSRATAGSPSFDGFCFRFAQPSDFGELADRVAPERAGLAEELRANVSQMTVTVPLDGLPERVGEFEAAGYATVVRLVLRSAVALEQTREQLAQVWSTAVPFNLFLERVERITVRTRAADGDETVQALTRTSRSLNDTTEEIRLQDGSTFLLLRRPVPEAAMLTAIESSRLNSRWARWKGDAAVCVAVPLGEPLAQGRFYTFLPMEEAAPLPAFVNAPFFAQLDRKSMNAAVPLNDMLLSQIAALCADAVRNGSALPGGVLLDLACWQQAALPRLVAAFGEDEVPLTGVPLVPALGSEDQRVPLDGVKLWRAKGTTISAEAVAATGVTLADSALGPVRTKRVETLARHLGLRLMATPAELAAWAEAVAADLARDGADPAVWAGFYDDLAAELRDFPEQLRGRRVLIGERGRLLPVTDEQRVFVRPNGEAAAPPAAVHARLAFLLPGIWRVAERPRRPGREWLENQKLVRDYHTETVLDLVGAAMRALEPDDHGALRECLDFAFDVWRRATREVSPSVVRDANLLVPTTSGWRKAQTATFGAGWGGSMADTDAQLARLLDAVAEVSGDLTRVAEACTTPAHLEVGDPEPWREFLEAAGVRHGLTPLYYPKRVFDLRGEHVANPAAAPLPDINLAVADKYTWREVAAGWKRQGPPSRTVHYRPATDVAVLPGQGDWPSFSPEARRIYAELILRGLEVWSDFILEIFFVRDTDSTRAAWPTFVSSFLATTEWIPQTTPGQRSQVTLAAPADAWWVRDEATPDYLRAQPHALRSLATPRVLERLRRAGVRFWDDPASARSRLDELTGLVNGHTAVNPAVRKAYEEAWNEIAEGAEPPGSVLVTRQSRLEVADLRAEGEPVYVCDEKGAAKERLLQQTPVAMLAIRSRPLAERVRRRLLGTGPNRLVPTSEVAVDVIGDGVPAADLPFHDLGAFGGGWLPTLVLGCLEVQQSSFRAVTAQRLVNVDRALSRCRLATATSVVAHIGPHRIAAGDSGALSFLLDTGDHPRMVVLAPESDRWTVLQAASGALAELAGDPQLEPSLRLALVDLRQRCGETTPVVADIAAVLRVPLRDLEAAIAGAVTRYADHSAVVAVLACVDLDVAQELREHSDGFGGRDELRAWLSATGVDADRVLALADRNDPLAAITELGVSLEKANLAFRLCGLPLLHRQGGHARQFEAFRQQHRAAILDRLRDRFLPMAERSEPLTGYLSMRDLRSLTSDEEWLDRYWELPEEVMQGRVEAWLDEGAPPAPAEESGLPPVDTLREHGRRVAVRAVTSARLVVEAWSHRSAEPVTGRPDNPETVASEMAEAGALDFKRIGQDDVITWLAEHGQWPAAMPRTTAPARLGLSEQDLTLAGERLQQASAVRHRNSVTTIYGGRKYGQEAEETQAFIDAVRASITLEAMNTPPQPAALPPMPLPASSSGRNRGGSGWQVTSAPPEVTARIGLAGELIAGGWIEHHFQLPPEVTWVSANRRSRFPDGRADDTLGYDFEIPLGDRRLLIEVKATKEAAAQITLGESEVRTAQSLEPHEDYWILFVTHALEPDRHRVHVLPNPLAPGGLTHYQVAGRSLRLLFQLPGATS
ncbi:sacsin N-terminal ATP-binding-like domain-containing protein [Dactylosporangium cerinum]|uniref:Sacsin N-terminal ATP-binding-like domain-containing protein n=1 Tax=Dactylosporangium cerinum TaxID=1434730 RepID=A0ABV9VS64_9ACTN